MFESVKAIEGTTDARRPLRKVPVWKGDHRGCEVGHADGVCRAIHAWRLDGAFRIVPTIVGRSTERRHQVMAEYSEESGKEQEAGWLAKGFRNATEAARAKPHAEITAKMRENGAEGVKLELLHRKASFADQQEGIREFFEKFDAANPPPKKGKPSDG